MVIVLVNEPVEPVLRTLISVQQITGSFAAFTLERCDNTQPAGEHAQNDQLRGFDLRSGDRRLVATATTVRQNDIWHVDAHLNENSRQSYPADC